MNQPSLHQMLRRAVAGLLAAMLLFHVLTVFINERTIRELNQTIQSQLSYDSFPSELEELQDSVTACFNEMAGITDDDVLSLADEFYSHAKALNAAFAHPQFEDNVRIVKAYLESIRSFFDSRNEAGASQSFQAYNRTMSLSRMVLESYETTSVFERGLVTSSLQKSSAKWGLNERIILLTGILGCILIFWRGEKLTDRLAGPILSLTEHTYRIMERPYEISPAPALPEGACRETFLLSEAFDRMAAVIRRQMEELQEKIDVSRQLHQLEVEHMQTQMSLKQAEMSLMQSLVSPHFLFNCLSTLTSLAFLEGAAQTEEASIQLAEYLRVFLDHIGKTVTIEEEAAHTEEYIRIQKLRFGNRIQFSITCSGDCLQEQIPALILQPCIENSLSHGLKNRKKGGRIETSIRKEGDQILIEVSDNGVGSSPSQLEHLEKELNGPFLFDGHEIGLKSVAYRLSDFSSGKARIRLRKTSPGFSVLICLPSAGRRERPS